MVSQTNEDDYVFVNIEQSITQRAVSSITQDHLGLIWMGTNGVGLNKYNGIDFTMYKNAHDNPNSLNSSLVYNAYVDSSNRLWVGTEAGLNLYNRELDDFEQILLDKGFSDSKSFRVQILIESREGILIVGTHQQGLFKVDPVTLETQIIPFPKSIELPNLLINSLVEDQNGKILVGTNLGLFEYDSTSDILEAASFESLNGPFGISNNIESMLLDTEGDLWIGTFSDGLLKISSDHENTNSLHTYKISEERIFTMVQAPDGKILCGTENDGLFAMDRAGKIVKNYRYNKFDKNSIKSNSVWSLFVDTQGRIWIGYYNSGVGIYDKFYDKFKDIESLPNAHNSLQSSSITGIVQDREGKLWIGIDGGGVDIYDPKDQHIVHLADPNNLVATGLNNLDVVAIFLDSRYNLWVGTWNGGIYYLAKNSDSFVVYNTTNLKGQLESNRIMSFSEDSKGVIWIGTFLSGLHSYDPTTNEFTWYNSKKFAELGINSSDMRKVLVDKDDNIWMGTTRGLYKGVRSAKSDMEVVSLNERMNRSLGNTVSTNLIVSLYEDEQKNIWIGTDGGGLCKFIYETNSFVWYNSSNGLEQETIASIIEADDGNIWMGGNKGLSRLETTGNKITNFNTNDGLLADDFNFNATFKDNNGILYFGNYGGVNFLDPATILVNENKPLLYFSDLKLFNESVVPNSEKSPLKKVLSETENITLNHRQSVFTIDFVGINYTRPEKTQYAYYLEGFEDTWNYVGNLRSATYTNLPSGEYTFKVKASNNDGIWNDSPITLGIKVLPAWWSTNIAILTYVILFLSLTYSLFRFLKQRLREKRLVKFERDQRRQEEILNERKIQFFTNISHEFRTPLTLILNPLRDIIENKRIQLNENVQDKHRIMLKNATRLTRLIDELMDFRKLHLNKMTLNASEIDAISFVREVSAHFEEEASEKNILFSVETDGTPVEIWGDPGMLEKIVFNILSNAFKATPENGVITVGVFSCKTPVILPLLDENNAHSSLEIVIEDSGKGINKEELSHIFERFYQSKDRNHQYYGGSGTGIGLEVTQSFVSLHKGKIEVESKEGEGTKFSIFLPFGNKHLKPSELVLIGETELPPEKETGVEANTPSISNETEIVESDTTFGAKKRTLLIVEDNLGLRNYLKGELENEYVIIEAENGKKGIERAISGIPDLIISDVIMPEMDGIEFCTLIKKDIKTSHIPVLMLTAKAMSDDRVKGIDSGADAYLNKPFEMKVLRSYLKRLINSRQNFLNRFLKDINNLTLPEKTTSLDRSFITKVLKYINENIGDTDLNVEQLADDMHLSRSQLYRKIKAMTGITANEFIRKIRLEKAKQMIENGSESISEVGFKVGFSSPSYFTKCFKSHFGILPTEVKPA